VQLSVKRMVHPLAETGSAYFRILLSVPGASPATDQLRSEESAPGRVLPVGLPVARTRAERPTASAGSPPQLMFLQCLVRVVLAAERRSIPPSGDSSRSVALPTAPTFADSRSCMHHRRVQRSPRLGER